MAIKVWKIYILKDIGETIKAYLEKKSDYMADGQVRSAAPGPGETTLGIEFIRRWQASSYSGTYDYNWVGG